MNNQSPQPLLLLNSATQGLSTSNQLLCQYYMSIYPQGQILLLYNQSIPDTVTTYLKKYPVLAKVDKQQPSLICCKQMSRHLQTAQSVFFVYHQENAQIIHQLRGYLYTKEKKHRAILPIKTLDAWPKELDPGFYPINKHALLPLAAQVPETGIDLQAWQKKTWTVGIGYGIKQAQMKQVNMLVQSLNAQLVCTQPIINQGWLSEEHLLGTSGREIDSDYYLALGISGTMQHIAGVSRKTTIIAINHNPSAAIFLYAKTQWVIDINDALTQIMHWLTLTNEQLSFME